MVILFFNSCGVPSFLPVPNSPMLRVTGIDTVTVDIPSGSTNTTGIVIMYKIFVDPVESQYRSEYDAIRNVQYGNLAYENLKNRGFRTVVIEDNSVSPPTIAYQDYPDLFDADTLTQGLLSSRLTKRVDIHFNSSAGLQILLRESNDTVHTIPLKRDSGVASKDFFPFAGNYDTGDMDLQHLSSTTIAEISSSSVYFSLAALTYIARRSFGEEDSFSVPYLLNWSELSSVGF